MRIHPITLCLGLGAAPGLATAAQAQYDATVLQDVGGAGSSEPVAINASGEIAGYSCTTSSCGELGNGGVRIPGADAVLSRGGEAGCRAEAKTERDWVNSHSVGPPPSRF